MQTNRKNEPERLMQRGAWLLALIALLQGCATQLALSPGTGAEDPDLPSQVAVLKFQSNSVAPSEGAHFLDPTALRPGDILLSSMPGLAAAGIRLVSFAPVSHVAVYVGDGRVVEAVRSGVRVRTIEEVLAEETWVLALRYPDLSPEQADRIRTYALGNLGAGFNFLGVTLHIPYSIGRRACELPLVPLVARDACIRGMGVIHQVGARESRLFCSQLVLQAYRHAGVPITDADPRLLSPADILHMREDDVSSVRIRKPLQQLGHLKYDRRTLVAFQH